MALAFAAGLFLPVPAVLAATVRITVLDQLGEGQVDEVIDVFSGGRSLGRLHVHAAQPKDSFEARLPDGVLDYVLCGRLVTAGPYGTPVTVSIDNGGSSRVEDGDTLVALRGGDLFMLQAPGGIGDVRPGPACDRPIS